MRIAVIGLLRQYLMLLFCVCGILVPEDQDFCAREPRAIDDGRMVQLIGDDEVVFS